MTSCVLMFVACLTGQGTGGETPRVLDPRLQLVEFASSPDIVTPVGIAVDRRGRVLVVESHTHFPPREYPGPKTDRIRLLVDDDRDGKAEKITTFYQGLTHTMGVAVGPHDIIYVATRAEVMRLVDDDEDGVAEKRETLVKLDTPGNYPHNGLSGFAFDLAGNVYFGFGENLGANYKLIGADGTTLSGGGEGGNIYRCDKDGKQLTRLATGFWNPFHLTFDAFGRLFAVDNDPDSRPPCRLLHVVAGGDYGYRFRNGRRGTHPFTAWNGELPGTLPMVAGTGEAPSGIVAYESDQWPDDYRGDLLVTSWGDHRLDRFRLRPRGASFVAESTPIVTGGEQFRPVGVAVAPDGTVYFSDWVDKSYELHGKGRVWRLTATTPHPRIEPDPPLGRLAASDRFSREAEALSRFHEGAAGLDALAHAMSSRPTGERDDRARVRATAAEALGAKWPTLEESRRKWFVSLWTTDPSPDVRALALEWSQGHGADLPLWAASAQPPLVRAAALRSMTAPPFREQLLNALDDADPFIRQAATMALARSKSLPTAEQWASLSTAGQKLGVALLLRESQPGAAETLIPALLTDSDPALRFVGIQWLAETRLSKFRPQLEETLRSRANTRQLFEACLAALERLDGGDRRPTDEWPGEQYVVRVLLDEKSPPEVRRRALRTLRPSHPDMKLDLLRRLRDSDDEALRIEAIRSLRDHPSPDRIPLLLEVVRGQDFSTREQAEAVMGLNADDPAQPDSRRQLIELACTAPTIVAVEALRGLRGVNLTDGERDRLRAAQNRSDAWRELLAKISAGNSPTVDPAASAAALMQSLEGRGDPEAGERIFHHPRATGCYRCHEYDGRGAGIGPDLTHVTRTMSRQRLVESLADPSREVAPQFTPWQIETEDGQLLTGMLVGEEVDGTQRYIDGQGREIKLKPKDIAERRPFARSIMPDGLPSLLTAQEFRDLVAFLLKPAGK